VCVAAAVADGQSLCGFTCHAVPFYIVGVVAALFCKSWVGMVVLTSCLMPAQC